MRGSLPPLCDSVPRDGVLTNWGAVGVRSAGGTPPKLRVDYIIEVIQSSRLFVALMLLLLTATFANAEIATAQCSPQSSDAHLPASITAEVVPFPPYHAAGNDVPTILRLKHADSRPVTLEDLHVSDAAEVDVLVVDENLSDFRYQHLTVTDTPGEYRFVLRSKYGGRYFVWVGVGSMPGGEKRFEKATVEVAGASQPVERVVKWSATIGEYHYHLSVADGSRLIAGQPARLNLNVIGPTGEPVELDPMTRVLGSLSALAADFESAMLMFPTADSIPTESTQGARQLTFVFTLPRAGFWRLFGEVKAGGFPRIASFGVNVSEASHCKDCAEACRCAEACSKMAT